MTKIRRIVCPTDFSPTAAHALEYATDLAKSFGAELVVMHVIPELNYPLQAFGMVSLPHPSAELHKRASDALAELRKLIPSGITARTELRNGDTYTQVLECAKTNGADLIVIGTQGHTGLARALLGSTAEKIVRLAECPVLTVRMKN